MRKDRALLWVGVVLSWALTSFASNSSQLIPGPGEQDYTDDIPFLATCRYFDSAENLSKRPHKRDLSKRGSHHFHKRTLDNFDSFSIPQKDTWMINAIDGLAPDQEVVPAWAEDPDGGLATIATKALGNQPVRLGMGQICGCTMLIVANHKRVYLGHYWEDQCFGISDPDIDDAAFADNLPPQDNPLHFNEQVLNFIANGWTATGGHVQDSLAQYRADFDSPDTFAMIMSPERGYDPNPRGILYDAKVPRMAQAVAQALGFDVDRVTQRAYGALDGNADAEELENTARGKLIFEYDPRADGRRGGRGATQSAWRAIWEYGAVLGDVWPIEAANKNPP